MVEVVLEDAGALRIEPGPLLGHEREHVLRDEDAVLELRAAGGDRATDALGGMRVHDAAKAE